VITFGPSTARTYDRDRGPIDRQVDDLAEQVRHLPAALPEGDDAQRSRLVQIFGGNSLPYLGTLGIKHVSTAITTAPAGTDVATAYPSGLPDGLGWGRWLDDGSYVLLVNDVDAPTRYDLILQPVLAIQRRLLTLPDDSTVEAYTVIGPA
jgi:hypothetical protein